MSAGAWPFSKGFLAAVQYHRYGREWTGRDSAYNRSGVWLLIRTLHVRMKTC